MDRKPRPSAHPVIDGLPAAAKRPAGERPQVKVYETIMRYVTDRIDSGQWPVGQQIPTEVELMALVGASRMTVHRALRDLASQGRITRKSGVGTFVAPARSYSAMFEIKSVATEIEERGGKYSARVLCQETKLASREIARELQIADRDPVYHVEIVHMEDGTPVQIEDRIVDARMSPAFIDQDFRKITPMAYLLSLSSPARIEHDIQAIAANRHVARLLAMELGDPVLLIKRVTWRAQKVSTVAYLYNPGHAYQLGASGPTTPGHGSFIWH